MQFLKDIVGLFYVDLCVSCHKSLLKDEQILCTLCKFDLPIIDNSNVLNNKVLETFLGRIPLKTAVSFLVFREDGVTQKLMHELKYKGNQEIGTLLGNLFGQELKNNKTLTDLDYIVPVPLHPKRKKERGYNQVTTFGEALSRELKTNYKPDILQRISATKTQTVKERFERFTNANTKFLVTDTSIFENKHILLIDDVITTGATLEACCNELLKTKNITISIATMAYTERY